MEGKALFHADLRSLDDEQLIDLQNTTNIPDLSSNINLPSHLSMSHEDAIDSELISGAQAGQMYFPR